MNCDDVFDVLTRGPFPSGDARCDVQVEAHLEKCDDCRRLAQALEPAIELFHEALGDDECSALPGYWGDRMGGREITQTATRAEPASNISARAQAFAQTIRIRSLLVVAAAMLLSVSATLAYFQFAEPAAVAPPVERLTTVDSLGITTACLMAPETHPVAGTVDARPITHAVELSQLNCCTHCHGADRNKQTASKVTGARVSQSCLMCHVAVR